MKLFSTEEEAVSGLEKLLGRPPDREAIGDFCRSHTWKGKTATLLEFISGRRARLGADGRAGLSLAA